MSRIYDNWERLVEAVLDREELRQLALCESFSSSISDDFSSRSSFDSSLEDVSASRISSDTIDPGAPSSTSSITYFWVQHIEFEEIKKATKNFEHNMIIGEGGFGPVYKGWIDEHTLTASKPGSGTAVAIKKWDQNGIQGHQEWMKEIYYLSQLHHPNLVRLIGYYEKEENMILAYEFVPKGSLDNHLFRRYQSLPWEIRIKVAIGAARGLSFLHDREIQVIHRGFKSGDILLDGEFNAKLSDFGLARDGPVGDMTHVSTRVMGTFGYAAPEYMATGHLTAKCDVYGFGIVLLELLSGRRAFDRNRAEKERKLVKWAKPYIHDKRKLSRIMDHKLEGQYPHKAAYTVATLASRCVSSNPKERPRMAKPIVRGQEREDDLSQFRHPNLVRVIGHCHKKEKMISVYEFMPKGGLDNHLFRRGHESLPWETRIKVAIGAARGLSFLHDGEIQVIHRGFNSGDILLDGEFNAKLSDFGLARNAPTDIKTHVSTRVMGTYGYAAPEYMATGYLTAKCDVYGFGVVLLELLTGHRAVDMARAENEQMLVKWAKPYIRDKRKLLRIMDATLEGRYPHKAAYTVATLALRCVRSDPKERPWMAEVLAVLEQL